MVEHTKTLKVGEGFEKDVFLGPLQNSMQYERVKGFFEAIDKENYNVAVGGKNPDGPGYFITPTIIDRPKEDSRIVVEEPFGKSCPPVGIATALLTEGLETGPIVPLLSFSTDDEAIERANNTPYGLGASVWSGDIDRATKVANELEAGSV